RVREAAADAATRWGVGAGASRLVSGTMTIHRRLEERLAAFEGSEAALLFGSGYLANIGVIGALAGQGDTMFSMDGDVAPLAEIAELAASYGARVVADEAHATGNLGPGGRGAVAQAGLEDEVDVVLGTLGKALGSYGAYVCASAEM